MLSKKSVVVFIIVFSMIFTSVLFYGYQITTSANFQVDREDTYLLIPPGANFTTVLDSLTSRDIIHDKVSFAFLAKLIGYQDKVLPGRYLITRDMSNLEAVRTLKSGRQAPVQLTFNNLRLKQQLAGRLTKDLMADSVAFLALLNDADFVGKYGFDTFNVTTMFIPNTYELFWTNDANDLFIRMNKEYLKFWNEERKVKADSLGMTQAEVSILASIVEAETNRRDERPRVAGVYKNRLDRGIALQADPTLVYALGDFTIKRVLSGHKKIDSPYNTYMYPGLPPGPIRIPSINAIDATLALEKHDYYFFCARPDFSGYHSFARNLRDHINNARAYQKALDKANIN